MMPMTASPTGISARPAAAAPDASRPTRVRGALAVALLAPALSLLAQWGYLAFASASDPAHVIDTPLEMALLVAIVQLVFLAIACVAAWRSGRPLADGLGLGPGRLPASAYPVLALGTLVAVAAGAILARALVGPPSAAHLERLEHFVGGPWASGLVLVVVASLGPALGEELLYRGWVQRRLLGAWSPWASLAATAIVWSGIHFELGQIVMALPLALWLGYVAWRADSIRPAVACHVAGALCVQGLFLAGVNDLTAVGWPVVVALVVVAAPSFLLSVRRLERAAAEDGADAAR